MNKKLKNFIQNLLKGDPNKRMGTFLNDKQKGKENNNISGKKKKLKNNIYVISMLKIFLGKKLEIKY